MRTLREDTGNPTGPATCFQPEATLLAAWAQGLGTLET